MGRPRSVILKEPNSFHRKTVDRITNYHGAKGDSLRIDMPSFGIGPEESTRANIGFGNCAAAIRKGASRDEAFLYQYRSGELFFNENGSEPGLGKGGLICIFSNAPALGAIHFDHFSLG